MKTALNIYLVRHAISEANLDKRVNARLPDAMVPLAPKGLEQAAAAGKALVELLRGSQGRTRLLCSPYLRTRQTASEITTELANAGVPFDQREELALREISFGLFDGIADDELPQRFPVEHAHYQKHVVFEGEFYAPMPMGESRVQVADRVKTVFGTILRDASKDREDRISNFIVVSHGVTIRAFLMQWLHLTPEWYKAQTNPGNASVTLISSDGTSPYEMSEAFAGFSHVRRKQDEREDGVVG